MYTCISKKCKIGMADRNLNENKTVHELASCLGIDEVPDVRAFMANPLFLSLFNYSQTDHKEIVKQTRDSVRVFQQDNTFSLSMILQFPNSPTAKNYVKAVNHFILVSEILKGYTKDRVEDLKDCEFLFPAFENIVQGFITENSTFEACQPPENTLCLAEQYLMLRPNDIFAEYVKVIILQRASYNPQNVKKNLLSDFESAKLRIKTSEIFASKLRLKMDSHPFQRRILGNVYYHLGANYVCTGQPERALDSFQKTYDLDHTNLDALYGIAYHYIDLDQTKAIRLFLQYINEAPKCDKKYPNAYYLIAYTFHLQGNIHEAIRHCSLAEEAEKKRLPFLLPVAIPQKTYMIKLKHSFLSAQIK
ncbi:uncharacterized protein LOC134686507 [Mytilus trossulus]|uniref:uncharacterized protein LOC134686507 n=1 Tax=Mytilus trossulus TaxID=6551 RepID=UPI0030056A01